MKNLSMGFALGLLFIGGCGHDEHEAPGVEARPPQEVKTILLGSETSHRTERAPGSVQSVMSATLEAKVSGRVEALPVREGSVVKKGDTLIRLSAREIEARLAQALASERQAQKDLERFRKLLPAGAVTRQEFDAAEARAATTRAGVAEARTMVEYSTIMAPFDGMVVKKHIEEGDLALPGKPLLTIERQDQFRFEADIPESSSRGLSIGNTLGVVLPGLTEELRGTIAEMSPTTDPNSRTRRVKINLPNNLSLQSGQFGYAIVESGSRSVIRVPRDAVHQRGQMEVTFVVENNRALLRLIRTGKEDGTTVEVLSGLREGEHVVTNGGGKLRDGDPVEVRP